MSYPPSQPTLAQSLITNLVEGLILSAQEDKDSISHTPLKWQEWLVMFFPEAFNTPFSPHHVEFWEWVEAIQSGESYAPFIAIWPRGGAKTTSAEAAVVRMGAKQSRKFCLYVRSTQTKANESIQSIAAMLESDLIEQYYPLFSRRKLSKYGFSRGWRGDMLRCANGFSVIGLGFDAAVRGIKIEEHRPDLIIFDDVDDLNDKPATTQKKINSLTNSILPAGSTDVAIIGVQNLILEGGIFYQLAHRTADFLHNAYVSGPFPAVENLTYERTPAGYTITGGTPTWAGQSLPICEKQINEWGLKSFLREAQHEVEQSGGIWDHIEFQHCDYASVPALVRGSVWVDPAVTNTDASDSQGLQADGLGVDGKLYRLYSWEKVTSPETALFQAILTCLKYGLDTVGVETDQGGDTWQTAYNAVWKSIYDAATAVPPLNTEQWENNPDNARFLAFLPYARDIASGNLRQPRFKSAKAGAGHGSKIARNQRMLVDYEQGKIVHVIGSHEALEHSLKRFPNKPLDLADAAYWGWWDLLSREMFGGSAASMRDVPSTNTEPIRTPTKQTLLTYLGDKSFPMGDWFISPGWSKRVDSDLASSIINKHPKYFKGEEG